MDKLTPPVSGSRYSVIRAIIITWMTLVILGAFLLDIPRMNILEHTARNLYFHVPMWFTMMSMVLVSGIYSARHLASGSRITDIRARESARVAAVFGVMGLITGILWAKFTWYSGTSVWWNSDPRQSMAAIQLLIYGAYFFLRTTIDDNEKRGRIAAVYNLIAAATVPFLLYVLPRQMESLHPGADGNPAFSEITAPIMRAVFYPAVIGFIAIAWLLYRQRVRVAILKENLTSD
ncbi:MAG: cytochrome c biogenesis protein CcsA [Rhodothermales bacterium]|nr:cytochrome c biogenesis protein CcsA [Rhodothermales bacterium]